MQTKRKVNRIILLMLCYFVSLNAFVTGATTEPAEVLRLCIEDQTYAVVHLDIEKLDLDAFVGRAQKLVNENTSPNIAKQIQSDLKNFQALAGAQKNGFLEAGGKDIFLVFSMYDFPHFP